MCGKNICLIDNHRLLLGSPPHVREKRLQLEEHVHLLGITPACAGKTLSLNFLVIFSAGSPPHVREKPLTKRRYWCQFQDHPRMCGKNIFVISQLFAHPGSPPHVREKLAVNCVISYPIRITPACAGKTTMICVQGLPRKDHPRMCGKNSANATRNKNVLGSPPHVREKPFGCLIIASSTRITPACAGKTHSCHSWGHYRWDHPRMCGKNRIEMLLAIYKIGSPPHVREKPTSRHSSHCFSRITPASAGKTDKNNCT